MPEFDQKLIWPHVFTCPAGSRENLKNDDLGEKIVNPLFSNGTKMRNNGEGCGDCDYRELGECNGPIAYAPVKRKR